MIKFCCYTMDANVSSANFDTYQFQNPRIQNINRKIIKKNKEIKEIDKKILKINFQILHKTVMCRIFKRKHQKYKIKELKNYKVEQLQLKSQKTHEVFNFLQRKKRLIELKQSLSLLDNDFLGESAF